MKKVLLILISAVAVQFAVAQTAQSVMARFLKQSGIEAFYAQRDGRSSLMEAQLSVGPQKIPMKVLALYPSQFRVEMDAMGQKVVFIIRDTVAWVIAPNQPAQRIDNKEQVKQLSPMTDLFAVIAPSANDYDMIYSGQDGKGDAQCDMVEFVKKSDGSKSMLYFNSANGMLQRATGSEKNIKVDMEFNKYAKFNDGAIEIPTSIVTKTPQGNVTINISNFELDYPTAAWMFAEPK